MNKPHTYTGQYLGKWHAGFKIGNQSFVLSAFEGTQEEASWYAEMMDKAFSKLRVVEEVDAEPNDLDDHYFPLRCSKCKVGFAAMEAHKIFDDEPLSEDNQTAVMRRVDYCPGCGNKIKR